MKSSASKIAFSGIAGALTLVLMLISYIIPIATYAVPALASLISAVVLYECGSKTMLTMFASVSILSLLIIADKELCVLYILFFGWYPLIKSRLDSLGQPFKLIFKLIIYAVCIAAVYALLTLVFPVPDIIAEFNEAGMLAAMVFMALLCMLMLATDMLTAKFTLLYIKKWRRLLFFKRS